MNNSGGDQQLARHGQELSSQQRNRPIALSRNVLHSEEESSISSLLYVGRLLSSAGGGAPEHMASLRTKLLRDWNPSGAVNFWRATDGAFLIQFYERADLARVLDGAPWCCDGDDLFVLQRAKPDVNLLDQVRFFKAELWVKFYFNYVPVVYLSEASIYALAAHIGELVKCPDKAASFFRARILVDVTRPLVASIDVKLEDGECRSISVEYERVGSILCGTCRILGHSADRCSTGNQRPSIPRNRSRLSRSSTVNRDDGGGSVGSSSSAGSGISPPLPPSEVAAAPPTDEFTSGMGVDDGGVPSLTTPHTRGLKYYFQKYLFLMSSKKKNPAGEQMVCNPADNMEADAQSGPQPVTSSPPHTSQGEPCRDRCTALG
nr:uncharacterized protein LOC107277033 isoform X2 [Oryza sativa Japonica Group]